MHGLPSDVTETTRLFSLIMLIFTSDFSISCTVALNLTVGFRMKIGDPSLVHFDMIIVLDVDLICLHLVLRFLIFSLMDLRDGLESYVLSWIHS